MTSALVSSFRHQPRSFSMRRDPSLALLLFLAFPGGDGLTYTHLGINGQLWEFAGGARPRRPVLVGDLTFLTFPRSTPHALHRARRRRAPGRRRRRLSYGPRVQRRPTRCSLAKGGKTTRTRLRRCSGGARRARGVDVVAPPSALATVECAADGGERARARDHGESVTPRRPPPRHDGEVQTGSAVAAAAKRERLRRPRRRRAHGRRDLPRAARRMRWWPAPPPRPSANASAFSSRCSSQSLARRFGPAFPLVKGETSRRARRVATDEPRAARGLKLDAAGLAATVRAPGDPSRRGGGPADVAFVRAPLGEPVVSNKEVAFALSDP